MIVSFNPAPKPTVEQVHAFMNSGARKGLMRRSYIKTDPAKVRAWQERSRGAIARKKSLPRATKPIPQRNERRIARKALAYRKIIASDFHKKLRYDAFLRSGGLCECARCRNVRSLLAEGVAAYLAVDVERAITPIPVWFTKKGGEPWRRFRSIDGETHHTSYKFFGEENPAELELVEWQWDSCHQQIEAEYGTRRRFLSGRKAA